MLTPVHTRQFERDLKRQRKRGKDLEKLKEILGLLIEEKVLPAKQKDHPLKGNFVGYRNCHIEPDWLLIYKIDRPEIYFVRTGTHSDLFE